MPTVETEGHTQATDPVDKTAHSEGPTAPAEESAADTLEKLEAEISSYTKEAEEKPKEKEAEEPAKTTPAPEPWYKDLKPGIDSEEKAKAWVSELNRSYGQLARDKAELEARLIKTSGQEKKDEEIEWYKVLEKHTQRDADGTVVNVNHNTALKEYSEAREAKLAKKIKEELQAEETTRTEITRAAKEVDQLAREGLIPEYKPAIYKDGAMVEAGSEFANDVDDYMAWSDKEFSKVPFHQHPHKEFFTTMFALGMKWVQQNREANKKKTNVLAEIKGAPPPRINVTKESHEMTGEESVKYVDRLAQGLGP